MKSPNLLKNMAALGVLQIANFTLSLAAIPYLTRALGVESWGRVAFVQIVINYLMWFCNWGFYLSATRKVAEFRSNPSKVSEILITNWVAQLILTFFAIVALVGLFTFVPFFSKDRLLYAISIGLLVSNALSPFWFLNGIERMRDVAFLQILNKASTLPLIFLFVHNSTDSETYVLINTGCALVFGILTMWWVKEKYVLSFSLPAMKKVFAELKEGMELFTASLCANLNGSVVPTVLGVIGGPVALGYYSLADRARGAATIMLHPITAALFPRMCHLFSSDSDEAAKLLMKVGLIVGASAALISIGLYVFSKDIIFLLGGGEFAGAEVALKWLAATPFLIATSSFGTHQIIIPAQQSRFYYSLTLTTLVVTASLAVPVIFWKGAEGASIVVFVGEFFLAASTYAHLLKNRFFLSRQPEFLAIQKVDR